MSQNLDAVKASSEANSTIPELMDAKSSENQEALSSLIANKSQLGKQNIDKQTLQDGNNRQCGNLFKLLTNSHNNDSTSVESVGDSALRVEVSESAIHACSVCSVRLSTAHRLRLHQARHSPGLLKCVYCDKHVGYLRNMRQHLRSLHKVDIRVCGLCKKKFSWHDEALDHDCPDEQPEARHYLVLSLDDRDRPNRRSGASVKPKQSNEPNGASQRPRRQLKRPAPSSPTSTSSQLSLDDDNDSCDGSSTASSYRPGRSSAKRARRLVSAPASDQENFPSSLPASPASASSSSRQQSLKPPRSELRRKAVAAAAASAAAVWTPPTPVLVQSAADVVAPFLNGPDRFRHPFALPWEPVGGPDGVEGRRKRWLGDVFDLSSNGSVADCGAIGQPVRSEGRVLAIRRRIDGIDEPLEEALVSWAWRPDSDEVAAVE